MSRTHDLSSFPDLTPYAPDDLDLIAALGDLACSPEEREHRRRTRGFKHWLHTSVSIGVSSRGVGDVEKISKTYEEGNEQQRMLLDTFRHVAEETGDSIDRMANEAFITTARSRETVKRLAKQVGLEAGD